MTRSSLDDAVPLLTGDPATTAEGLARDKAEQWKELDKLSDSLVGFQCFCFETLADQPANGHRARRLISLSAPPIINGVSKMRGDAETQDWILADSGSPALFLYYFI
jgi:hypothetical protein